MTDGKKPVKVAMKGLHQVTRKLADGSTRQHFYAWRGGPRMDAAPGTPEFVAEFQRLTADRLKPLRSDGTFQAWANVTSAKSSAAESAGVSWTDRAERGHKPRPLRPRLRRVMR